MAVVKMLKKIQHLSNINLVKNADGLIASENIDFEVECICKTGKRLPQNKYKMSYQNLFLVISKKCYQEKFGL